MRNLHARLNKGVFILWQMFAYLCTFWMGSPAASALTDQCVALFTLKIQPPLIFEVSQTDVPTVPRGSPTVRPLVFGNEGDSRHTLSVHFESQSGDKDLKVFFIDPVQGISKLAPLELAEERLSRAEKAEVNGQPLVVAFGASASLDARLKNPQSSIYIIDPMKGELVNEVTIAGQPQAAVIVRRHGNDEILSLDNGHLTFMELPSGKIRKQLKIEKFKIETKRKATIALRYKRKGEKVVVIATDKAVHIVNEKSGKLIKLHEGDYSTDTVGFEADGKAFIASLNAVPASSLRVLGLKSGHTTEVPIGGPYDTVARKPLLFFENGSPMIAAIYRSKSGPNLAIVDPIAGRVLATPRSPFEIQELASFQGGDRTWIAAFNPMGVVKGATVRNGQISASDGTLEGDARDQIVIFDSAGRHATSVAAGGGIRSAPAFFRSGQQLMMTYSNKWSPTTTTQAIRFEPFPPLDQDGIPRN